MTSTKKNKLNDIHINKLILHHKIHHQYYQPSDTLLVMTIKNIIWGVMGLILGIFINDTVIFLSQIFKIKNYFIQNLIQIILCAIILAIMYTQHKYIGWTLNNTLPGFFFISFLFGVQFKLLNNIQRSYMINNSNANDDDKL